MNIQSTSTIFQENNSLENQNKQEIFFTAKLVKSGLADMLWQLSLLYRIGQLFDYTYVHTLIAHDKRHRLSLFGKITKKIENVVANFFKIDKYSYKILLSIVDESKTVVQICNENENVIPISSTYKKIKRLKEAGLLFIDKIVINNDGKKVIFYKSKIQSIEMILNKKQFILQFKKNENNFSKI